MRKNSRTSATPSSGRSLEELNELTGYEGSIQGTPLDDALDEQRKSLYELAAIVETVAKALRQEFGSDIPVGTPHYPMALQRVAEMIEDVVGAIEGGTLEKRAIEIGEHRKLTEGNTHA